MKKIFFLILIAFATTAAAQNNNYTISMDGLGAIKLGMTQAELEKLLGNKIPLTNPWDTVSGSWQDSAKIKYKNITVLLDFQRNYFAEDTFNMIIIGIQTSSPLCKTKAGIGIGVDKLKVIAAYEENDVYVLPDYEDDSYTSRSKTKATINVKDESGKRMIVFYMKNKKVVGCKIKTSFSDEE